MVSVGSSRRPLSKHVVPLSETIIYQNLRSIIRQNSYRNRCATAWVISCTPTNTIRIGLDKITFTAWTIYILQNASSLKRQGLVKSSHDVIHKTLNCQKWIFTWVKDISYRSYKIIPNASVTSRLEHVKCNFLTCECRVYDAANDTVVMSRWSMSGP